MIITEKFPKHLKDRKKGKDRSIIARYRCGNETKGSQYWRKDDDRKCRICREAEESLFHILKECDATKNDMSIEEFIGEGKGLELMKKIEKLRKER